MNIKAVKSDRILLFVMKFGIVFVVAWQLLSSVSIASALPNSKNGQWGSKMGFGSGSKGNSAANDGKSKGTFFKKRQEREQLYEAYNLLHSLAQVSFRIQRLSFPP